MATVFPEPEYKLQPIAPGHPIWRMQDIVRPDSPYAGRSAASNTAAARASSTAPKIFRATGNWPAPANGRKYPEVTEHIRRRARDRRQRPHLRHQPRTQRQRTNLRHAARRGHSATRPAAASSKSPNSATAAAATTRPAHSSTCSAPPSQGELKLQVRAAPELINISDPNLFKYHMVFMHGRQDFHLTDAERTRLREYLERGGTLLADSICASKPFAAALPPRTRPRPRPLVRAHPRQRPNLHHRLRRLRHPPRLAPRPASRRRQSARLRPRPPGRTATRRHPNRRPLGRRLLALRHQLRPRKPPRHRLPRLHPTRRRPHRPQRAAVFAESVGRLELRRSARQRLRLCQNSLLSCSQRLIAAHFALPASDANAA